MSFVRVKIIKGLCYLYLVENTWINDLKASRQKVLKYIGRSDKYLGKISSIDVFRRDNYTCCLCSSQEELTIDHKIPFCKGGQNTIDNIWTLCKKCNHHKGIKILSKSFNHSLIITNGC